MDACKREGVVAMLGGLVDLELAIPSPACSKPTILGTLESLLGIVSVHIHVLGLGL